MNTLYTSTGMLNPLSSAGFNSVDQMGRFENSDLDSIKLYYSGITAINDNIGSFNLEHQYKF